VRRFLVRKEVQIFSRPVRIRERAWALSWQNQLRSKRLYWLTDKSATIAARRRKYRRAAEAVAPARRASDWRSKVRWFIFFAQLLQLGIASVSRAT
jgi:hypothetical protein